MSLNTIPARRKHKALGLRSEPQIRNASHMKFVRGFECVIAGKHECYGKIEAHHVRTGTDGGTSLKPGDNWCIPACSAAHREIHDHGELTFEMRRGVDLKAIAAALWRRSPHRHKSEA